ncbi:MAG TPA: glycosyl hydrolase family 28-related protein [Ktedonobacterales bacterium]|nr:glycosyl hydrolase family 28-related protein [Ktedonobacterales bacterium]
MSSTPDQFTNFGSTTIAGGSGGVGTPLNPTDTTLYVPTGDGNAKLPSTANGSFMIWLGTTGLAKCTVRSGDTLTIVRGNNLPAPDTTGADSAWPVGTTVQVVFTAGSLADLWNTVQFLPYNVKSYGAKGDGTTDDTTPIANARAAAAVTGGRVYYPPGTYISGPQTIYNNVIDEGDGPESTVIKLKNGANADLFSANAANINLSAAAGTSSNTAVSHFGFRNITLDGNYANQTIGPCYPIRVYGYGFLFQNLWVRNGYSGGILTDYNGAFPGDLLIESTWINVRSYNNKGITTAIGIECGGPHDSRWTNVLSYYNNSHDFHLGPNFGGCQATGCHGWNSGLADANSCTWLVEASIYASNCEAEGSPYMQLVLLGVGQNWTGGAVYSGGLAGAGIQIGQAAGGTPYTNSTNQSAGAKTSVSTSSYTINTLVENITHASGALVFTTDGGGVLTARVLAASGTNVLYSGTPGQKTTLTLNTQGFNSPTPQQLTLYGSGHSGQGGPYGYGTTASADPGNNGTIATTGSAVILLNPAAAETGLILGSGQFDGQIVNLINLSAANSLTFAAAITSHVADGVADVIAANNARRYVWYSLTALWYPCK